MLPFLRKQGTATQLIVGDGPFLVLGGELGNSAASDLKTLQGHWKKLQRMHLNTVLVPVYWDLTEPVEGQFDFALLEGAIEGARQHGLRVVLLWFGTWKNSMSCYAPGWVKRNERRFPRARRASGEIMEIISPLSRNAREADARAFVALMRRVREVDGDQTVIMVQVENEIGMIPDARDYSAEANAAYAAEVPRPVMDLLGNEDAGAELMALWESAGKRASGSWAKVFGSDAWGAEVFTAWHFGAYVEEITRRGKAEYALPMFTNAALMRPAYEPGRYPSGGPLPHLLELWRAAAPSLDFLSPDIYFPNFSEWAARYRRGGNPLFIPEAAATGRVGANAMYAIGAHDAIGFAPFAIESVGAESEATITHCYELLAGLTPAILEHQGKGALAGLSPRVSFDWEIEGEPQRIVLGQTVLEARFDRPPTAGDGSTTTLPTLGAGRWSPPTGTPLGGGLILQLGPEEFLIAGMGVVVTFESLDGRTKVGIDRAQEGRFDRDGVWQGGRWLNGDETHQGRHIHLYEGNWSIQRVWLYRYG